MNFNFLNKDTKIGRKLLSNMDTLNKKGISFDKDKTAFSFELSGFKIVASWYDNSFTPFRKYTSVVSVDGEVMDLSQSLAKKILNKVKSIYGDEGQIVRENLVSTFNIQ